MARVYAVAAKSDPVLLQQVADHLHIALDADDRHITVHDRTEDYFKPRFLVDPVFEGRRTKIELYSSNSTLISIGPIVQSERNMPGLLGAPPSTPIDTLYHWVSGTLQKRLLEGP